MSLDQERTTEDMIGRADVNDIEAILAITNTDRDACVVCLGVGVLVGAARRSGL